jgi:hypothetical protein
MKYVNKISIFKSLNFALETIKKNLVLISILALSSLVSQLLNFFVKPFYPTQVKGLFSIWRVMPLPDLLFTQILIPFVIFILSVIIGILYTKVGIYAYDHEEKVSINIIKFPTFSLIIRYIWILVLFALLLIVGFAALIIPCFIIAITYFWISFIMVEHKHLSVKEIFHKSFVLTNGIRWYLFSYFLLFFIVLQSFNFLLIYLMQVNFTSGIFSWKIAIIRSILYLTFTPIFFLSQIYLYKNRQTQQDEMVKTVIKEN